MTRTKKRALVVGTVSSSRALIYASILGISGFLVLVLLTNLVAAAAALTGFIFYVLLYTPLKPRSVHATLVGSIAGAVVPVVGYTAAVGYFDLAAGLLFLVLIFWQMPHFYAIAMYRFYDYFGAALPVLPVKKGMKYTKVVIAFYVTGFFITSSLLFIFGYTGYIYLLVMLLVSLSWFFMTMQGFKAVEDAVWARQVFHFSLVVLLSFSLMISLNSYLV